MYLIKTTSNDETILKKIAQKLVKKDLSKCVHIIKLESIYKWQGKIQNDDEYCLEIKSNNVKKVYKVIKKHHNYECFEFVYYKFKASKEYLKFLKEK
ncbi:divalent-cation tolerance protein CutA [Campylobacter sp. Cr9]|uniref:divalent cation tolerance protein CutA n=1 Tax=Campylobacter sp. Cr9 TaxID=2735728 RepID=UPI00301535B7|nr:divalent-cation tolerance protein CutA [Campylobacter sp. Cr9]